MAQVLNLHTRNVSRSLVCRCFVFSYSIRFEMLIKFKPHRRTFAYNSFKNRTNVWCNFSLFIFPSSFVTLWRILMICPRLDWLKISAKDHNHTESTEFENELLTGPNRENEYIYIFCQLFTFDVKCRNDFYRKAAA